MRKRAKFYSLPVVAGTIIGCGGADSSSLSSNNHKPTITTVSTAQSAKAKSAIASVSKPEKFGRTSKAAEVTATGDETKANAHIEKYKSSYFNKFTATQLVEDKKIRDAVVKNAKTILQYYHFYKSGTAKNPSLNDYGLLSRAVLSAAVMNILENYAVATVAKSTNSHGTIKKYADYVIQSYYKDKTGAIKTPTLDDYAMLGDGVLYVAISSASSDIATEFKKKAAVIENYKNAYANLANNYNSLAKNYNTYQESYKTVYTAYTEAREKLLTNQSAVSQLNTQLATLTEQYNASEATRQKMENEVEALRVELENERAKLSAEALKYADYVSPEEHNAVVAELESVRNNPTTMNPDASGDMITHGVASSEEYESLRSELEYYKQQYVSGDSFSSGGAMVSMNPDQYQPAQQDPASDIFKQVMDAYDRIMESSSAEDESDYQDVIANYSNVKAQYEEVMTQAESEEGADPAALEKLAQTMDAYQQLIAYHADQETLDVHIELKDRKDQATFDSEEMANVFNDIRANYEQAMEQHQANSAQYQDGAQGGEYQIHGVPQDQYDALRNEFEQYKQEVASGNYYGSGGAMVSMNPEQYQPAQQDPAKELIQQAMDNYQFLVAHSADNNILDNYQELKEIKEKTSLDEINQVFDKYNSIKAEYDNVLAKLDSLEINDGYAEYSSARNYLLEIMDAYQNMLAYNATEDQLNANEDLKAKQDEVAEGGLSKLIETYESIKDSYMRVMDVLSQTQVQHTDGDQGEYDHQTGQSFEELYHQLMREYQEHKQACDASDYYASGGAMVSAGSTEHYQPAQPDPANDIFKQVLDAYDRIMESSTAEGESDYQDVIANYSNVKAQYEEVMTQAESEEGADPAAIEKLAQTMDAYQQLIAHHANQETLDVHIELKDRKDQTTFENEEMANVFNDIRANYEQAMEQYQANNTQYQDGAQGAPSQVQGYVPQAEYDALRNELEQYRQQSGNTYQTATGENGTYQTAQPDPAQELIQQVMGDYQYLVALVAGNDTLNKHQELNEIKDKTSLDEINQVFDKYNSIKEQYQEINSQGDNQDSSARKYLLDLMDAYQNMLVYNASEEQLNANEDLKAKQDEVAEGGLLKLIETYESIKDSYQQVMDEFNAAQQQHNDGDQGEYDHQTGQSFEELYHQLMREYQEHKQACDASDYYASGSAMVSAGSTEHYQPAQQDPASDIFKQVLDAYDRIMESSSAEDESDYQDVIANYSNVKAQYDDIMTHEEAENNGETTARDNLVQAMDAYQQLVAHYADEDTLNSFEELRDRKNEATFDSQEMANVFNDIRANYEQAMEQYQANNTQYQDGAQGAPSQVQGYVPQAEYDALRNELEQYRQQSGNTYQPADGTQPEQEHIEGYVPQTEYVKAEQDLQHYIDKFGYDEEYHQAAETEDTSATDAGEQGTDGTDGAADGTTQPEQEHVEGYVPQQDYDKLQQDLQHYMDKYGVDEEYHQANDAQYQDGAQGAPSHVEGYVPQAEYDALRNELEQHMQQCQSGDGNQPPTADNGGYQPADGAQPEKEYIEGYVTQEDYDKALQDLEHYMGIGRDDEYQHATEAEDTPATEAGEQEADGTAGTDSAADGTTQAEQEHIEGYVPQAEYDKVQQDLEHYMNKHGVDEEYHQANDAPASGTQDGNYDPANDGTQSGVGAGSYVPQAEYDALWNEFEQYKQQVESGNTYQTADGTQPEQEHIEGYVPQTEYVKAEQDLQHYIDKFGYDEEYHQAAETEATSTPEAGQDGTDAATQAAQEHIEGYVPQQEYDKLQQDLQHYMDTYGVDEEYHQANDAATSDTQDGTYDTANSGTQGGAATAEGYVSIEEYNDLKSKYDQLLTSYEAAGHDPEGAAQDDPNNPDGTAQDDPNNPDGTAQDDPNNPDGTAQDDPNNPDGTPQDDPNNPDGTAQDDPNNPDGTAQDDPNNPDSTAQEGDPNNSDSTAQEGDPNNPDGTAQEGDPNNPDGTAQDDPNNPDGTPQDDPNNPDGTAQDDPNNPDGTAQDDPNNPDGTAQDDPNNPDGTPQDDPNNPDGTAQDDPNNPDGTAQDDPNNPDAGATG